MKYGCYTRNEHLAGTEQMHFSLMSTGIKTQSNSEHVLRTRQGVYGEGTMTPSGVSLVLRTHPSGGLWRRYHDPAWR